MKWFIKVISLLFVSLILFNIVFPAIKYSIDKYNPKTKQLAYVRAYENKKYKVGDQVIVANECMFEIEGKILLITDKGFYIHGVFKRFLLFLQLPYFFKYITDGTYFPNYALVSCLDGVDKGVRIKVSLQKEDNGQPYLLQDSESDGYSTMPMPF